MHAYNAHQVQEIQRYINSKAFALRYWAHSTWTGMTNALFRMLMRRLVLAVKYGQLLTVYTITIETCAL